MLLHSSASQVLREYRISNAQVSIRCNATMDDIIDTLEARVYGGVETDAHRTQDADRSSCLQG